MKMRIISIYNVHNVKKKQKSINTSTIRDNDYNYN